MRAMTQIPGASLDAMPATMPEALDRAWKAVRRRTRSVPAATVQVAAGRASSCGSVAWDSAVILVPVKTVAGGPKEVLGFLLHQAAHGLLAARGMPAATGEGRYHNAAYRDAAQQLGLEVSFTRPGIGWSATAVSDHLAQVYAESLRQIGEAAGSFEPQPTVSRRSDSRNFIAVKCRCEPPRLLRGGKATLDKGPVTCGVCGSLFEVRP